MTTVVIGAGIAGLVRAYVLAANQQDVILLEESVRVGGVIRTERRDGFLLEFGPNTVRPTAPLWDLIRELGLEREAVLSEHRAPRFVDFGGKLHAVPMSPAGFLSTRLLSVSGKIRVLGEPFASAPAARPESVAAFFARRLGPQVAQRLIEPFVAGVFAGDASTLSVEDCFPTLANWEEDHGSLLLGAFASLRGPRKRRSPARGLLTFRDGLAKLPEALASRLEGVLRTGTQVEKIVRFANTWTVRTSRGDIPATRIVIATPAYRAARLVEEFSPSAARALDAIVHPPLVVAHLAWPTEAFAQPLRGFGHLVVPQSGRRILGAVYSSSLFADRAPRGQALITAFLGGARDPQAAELSDAGLAAIAARDLASALAVRGAPRVLQITRYVRALPQYDLAHQNHMIALKDAEIGWPGLSFLGNYRGGVSVGDVVSNARGQDLI